MPLLTETDKDSNTLFFIALNQSHQFRPNRLIFTIVFTCMNKPQMAIFAGIADSLILYESETLGEFQVAGSAKNRPKSIFSQPIQTQSP